MPLTIEMRCAIIVSAYSVTVYIGSVDDFTERNITGNCDGLFFVTLGGCGMLAGKAARETAACTSCVAASMLRVSSNCTVMAVPPCVLDELNDWTPAIVAISRSNGVATELAMVSGLAPGRPAVTCIVG